MAKSSTYFGLRRGSTKSHTFSVVDGKQITKDRVEGCKNPRTLAQMSQRCMVATVGVAYSAMKCICDHSFEDLTAGMQCMRNFMHENLKQIRISKEYGNGFFGFCKFQESGLVPGSYGFGAVRFTYKSGATVLESFPVAVIGDFAGATPSFSSNTLKVEVRLAYNLAEGATTGNTYMAAITSRCVNGNWLRSPAQFDVIDATPTFAQAIATYPVGQERFLNGSDVDIVNYAASQSGSSSQSGSDSQNSGNYSGSGSNTNGSNSSNSGDSGSGTSDSGSGSGGSDSGSGNSGGSGSGDDPYNFG